MGSTVPTSQTAGTGRTSELCQDQRQAVTHPETPRAYQRTSSSSPIQTIFTPTSISRDASVSGRSASWSISTGNTASTGQTSPISMRTSAYDNAASKRDSSETSAAPTVSIVEDVEQHDFDDSFRSATERELVAEIDGSGHITEQDRRRGVSAPSHAFLPTPPDSEKRSPLLVATHPHLPDGRRNVSQPEDVARTLYESTAYVNAFTPPLSPLMTKAKLQDAAPGQAMQRDATVQEHVPRSEGLTASDGFPTLYQPSSVSCSSNGTSAAPSAIGARAPSPCSQASGFAPLPSPLLANQSMHTAAFGARTDPQQYTVHQHVAIPHMPQTPSMDAYQAHQLMLLRNMQAMQAQLQYVQAGLFPNSGRNSNPGTPLLSHAPNGTWPPASHGILPQPSPSLIVSPRTPGDIYGFSHLHPHSSISQYVNATASTSYGPPSVSAASQSTSYPDGTLVEHASAGSSASSRRRQSSYGDLSISTPPSSSIAGKRKGSRKYSKGAASRPTSYNGMMARDGLGSPSPAARDVQESVPQLGDESFGYSHGRRPLYNSYRRRDSGPIGTSSSSGKKVDRGQKDVKEKEQLSENLAILDALQDDEALDEDGRKTKLKAMEAVLERKGKELEIANWKLKCVEVDRLNTETEHQKALNHFYERAERAEARLRLLDSTGKAVPESSSTSSSPQLQTASLLPDGSDSGTDANSSLRIECDEVSPDAIRVDEPSLTWLVKLSIRTQQRKVSDATPSDVQSPLSPYPTHIGSPNPGPPLRYPPHPYASKGGRRNTRTRKSSQETPQRLDQGNPRCVAPKSSNGSIDSRASPAEDEGTASILYTGSDEDEDDLEIVLHSAGRSPSLPPTSINGQVPSSLPLLDEAVGAKAAEGTVGLGFSVTSALGNNSPTRSDIVTPNYVGSLPSFTFSKPPKSPTRHEETDNDMIP